MSSFLFHSSPRLLQPSIKVTRRKKTVFFSILKFHLWRQKKEEKKLREKESKQKLCVEENGNNCKWCEVAFLLSSIVNKPQQHHLRTIPSQLLQLEIEKKLFASFLFYSRFKLPHDEASESLQYFLNFVTKWMKLIGKFSIKSVIEVVQSEFFYLERSDFEWKSSAITWTSLWARRKLNIRLENPHILVQASKELQKNFSLIFQCCWEWTKSDKLKCCAVIWVFWSDNFSPHYSWKKSIFFDISICVLSLWPEKTWKNHLDVKRKNFFHSDFGFSSGL